MIAIKKPFVGSGLTGDKETEADFTAVVGYFNRKFGGERVMPPRKLRTCVRETKS